MYAGERLSSVTIGLLDNMPSDSDIVNPSDVDICGNLPSNTSSDQWYEVSCNKTGRVVIIQHQIRTDYLTVCEVQVYAYAPAGM